MKGIHEYLERQSKSKAKNGEDLLEGRRK